MWMLLINTPLQKLHICFVTTLHFLVKNNKNLSPSDCCYNQKSDLISKYKAIKNNVKSFLWVWPSMKAHFQVLL